MSDMYGESYYRSHLATGSADLAYERSEHWMTFFGMVADNIVTKLHPITVLDAGCALGLLVETLRDRGVDARGVDVSDYAISQAHAKVRDHVRVGSLTEPLGDAIDLVTCVEVLEHIPASEINEVVKNLTSITDRVLMSSTPDDYAETTHLNVQPPEYWAALFAEHGFIRDLDFDGSFLTPWAMLFRRSDAHTPDVVRGYERDRWHLVRERDQLRQVAVETFQNAAEGGRQQDRDLIQDLRHQLRDALDAAHGADAARATAAAQLRQVEYELAAVRGREAEVAPMLEELERQAHGGPERIFEVTNSRLFRIYWRLLTPYRRLRGR